MTISSAASATTFTYSFLNKGDLSGTQTFSATSGTSSLGVKISAWHADADYVFSSKAPYVVKTGTDTIDTAKLGVWQDYGIGVLYGNDTASDGTHQIDNVDGGSDFVMLQFDQAVTLSSITRNYYTLDGSCCDSDASYFADTDGIYGKNVTSKTSLDLDGKKLTESLFTSLSGVSGYKATDLGTTKSASVWFVAAALGQSDDGFKLAGLTATTASVAAVPEPATWGMTIIGFGAIGGALRRRRSDPLALAI